MGNALVKAGLTSLGINWAAFLVANAFKSERFYDATGSITFLVLVLQSLLHSRTFFPRQVIQSNLVVAWGARLGSFLFIRILMHGKDARFDKIKTNPSLFFVAWTLQALWVWVSLSPTLILNSRRDNRPLCLRDYVGWSIWLAGMVVEGVADYQKLTFQADPANANRWINSGLWSMVRHPNYLGEILLWTGLLVSASSVFRPVDHLAVLSPVLIALQLIHVSGIRILERRALRRWGEDPGYQHHLRSTYRLIPYVY